MKLYRLSFFIFCLSVLTTHSLEAKRLSRPIPYNLVRLLKEDDCGSGKCANAEQLHSLISSKKAQSILEIGCGSGNATKFLAALLPDGGKIYAVDAWSCFHESDQKKVIPFQRFLSNIVYADQADKVVPIRLDSQEAALMLNIKTDIVLLDLKSQSTNDSYQDLVRWFPCVLSGGYLCGNGWNSFAVKAAVRRFAQEHKFFIRASGNFWSLVNTL